MKPDIWMPLYIGDYYRDTMHLSTLEHGAYMLLLFNYWVRGKALPDSNNYLAKVAGLTVEEWLEHRPILASFFDVQDGLWSHKRVEEELRRANRVTQARSNAAKAMWSKRSANASANAEQVHLQTDCKPAANAMQNPLPSQSQSPSQSDPQSQPSLNQIGTASPAGDVAAKKAKASSQEEVIAFCQAIDLPASDGEWFWNKCEGNGWKNAKSPIKDWKAVLRSWKTAGYLPSSKGAQPPSARDYKPDLF